MLNEPFPVVLLILDGFGIATPSRGNAISMAYTPNFTNLINTYPATTLQASGEMVGLPFAEMGNSEVGHLNIGGGRKVDQNLQLLNNKIMDNSFAENQAFAKAIQHVKNNNSRLHIMGLTSEGGIHSALNHLYALLEICQQQEIKEVYIHAFLDGRDTAHNSGLKYISDLENRMRSMGVGKIASLAGRFYAMDRDNHWDRIAKAYRAMVLGQADYQADNALQAIEDSYHRQVFDEEFIPTVITDQGKPVATIQDNDSLIFINFRADRARQMTKAFCLPGFDKFSEHSYMRNLCFATMMEYEKNLPVNVAFFPDKINMPLARVISEAGLRQIHIAETEKYAHVTFFFNGGREEAFTNEDRVIIPSPAVSSYAQAPQMSAMSVKDKIVEAINGGEYHFILANFANADMVGHTGDIAAAKIAVETLDRCLGEIVPALLNTNGTLIITADHGNAEEMLNLVDGNINKEHSTNPVPFILVGRRWMGRKNMWPTTMAGDLSYNIPSGVLSDIAPTVLNIMNLPIPAEMTQASLLR
ncbi:MAG: 2,3-bisphosphoglycerate-independent phosphoglycerate mutase [Patescibacteria group bacterium]